MIFLSVLTKIYFDVLLSQVDEFFSPFFKFFSMLSRYLSDLYFEGFNLFFKAIVLSLKISVKLFFHSVLLNLFLQRIDLNMKSKVLTLHSL